MGPSEKKMELSQRIISDEFLEILQEEEKKEPKERKVGEYYASSALMCKRSSFYSFFNCPKERPPPKGIYILGRRVEDIYYEKLKEKYSYYLKNDIRTRLVINDEIEVVGFTDPVILGDNLEAKVVLEIKSRGGRWYVPEPNTHHVAQLLIYLRALRCTDGRLVYISRENLENIKEFQIDPLSAEMVELWEKVKSWYIDLHKYVKTETLPPAVPEESWQCSYCDYELACRSDYDAKKEREMRT